MALLPVFNVSSAGWRTWKALWHPKRLSFRDDAFRYFDVPALPVLLAWTWSLRIEVRDHLSAEAC
ncbi:hypothetical protein FF011L_30050 [Roseimaritima multifibrata]|uniref:Uncharacterized protein n=1 Tax=Roseimaritima multifibrata TaxID=1930274 RepID=A0A517MH67_9BACT|nr:hypothetical protein FF011L_30050 [Roseimaritima multifibrata]